MTLWPIHLSFVNNSWKNRITTSINQCSLTRFQTNLCHQYGILWAELQTSLSHETSLVGRSKRDGHVLTGQWWIQGRAPGGPPPLLLDQTEAWRAEKHFFETAAPFVSGSGWPGPPLICRSGPPLQAIMVERLTCQLLFSESVKLVFTFFSREARSHNLRARIRGLFFGFLGILLPFVLLVNFLASSSAKGTLDNFVGKNVSEKLHIYTVRAILFSTSQC